MERGKIVIIEGTSCVGKTTLCSLLEKQGWIVIPEAIRYLEKETSKIGDEASPIPGSQQEEEYYQDQLFRIELQKIIEANELSKQGIDVVIDKSAVATIATAKAFELSKNFNGTFKRAFDCYYSMLDYLAKNDLIECDLFLLLTSDYETILKRNLTRKHVLEGIWTQKETIDNQRLVLEDIVNNCVGNYLNREIVKEKIDTTNLTTDKVLDMFNKLIDDLNKKNNKAKGLRL